MRPESMERVFRIVEAERYRQDTKWGVQVHDDDTWFKILSEEMGELSKALLPPEAGQEGNPVQELVEVIAVGVVWLEDVMRREK